MQYKNDSRWQPEKYDIVAVSDRGVGVVHKVNEVSESLVIEFEGSTQRNENGGMVDRVEYPIEDVESRL